MSRLYGLDALRGIAALLVLWLHLHLSHRIGFYPPRGNLAVDFFFMLSGYVMARTYEGKLKGGFWFLRKRFRRLWPTVAIGSIMGIPLLWMSGRPDFAVIAAFNLLLLPILWAGAVFPLNTPIWSIFFELFANVVHGFWLHRVRMPVLWAVTASSGLLALCMALKFGNYGLGSNSGDFIGGFPRVIFAYFLGVILYRVWQDKAPLKIHPSFLFLLVPFLFTRRDPITDFAFVAFACPLIIAIGIAAKPGRWATAVGNLSFPLYAVHRPVLGIAAAIGAGWLVAGSMSVLAAAVVLYLTTSERVANWARWRPGYTTRHAPLLKDREPLAKPLDG